MANCRLIAHDHTSPIHQSLFSAKKKNNKHPIMHGLKQETPGSKNQLYHNNMILKNISKLINNWSFIYLLVIWF